MDRQTDGHWMDRKSNGWTVIWTDRHLDEWTDRWTDRRIYGPENGWIFHHLFRNGNQLKIEAEKCKILISDFVTFLDVEKQERNSNQERALLGRSNMGTDGRIDGQMDRWTHGRTDGCMDAWMH
jgi:hypothetical protein